jgi:tetratricopeptide (TPR) repeat protein
MPYEMPQAKAPDGDRSIVVATSIPPVLARQDGKRTAEQYQALCIRSWIGNGFRVISVNHQEEIAVLAARFPEVTFVHTLRDASEWTGRKNPLLADLLLALKDASEPVLGIINSDLLFEPSAAWTAKLPSLVGETLVVAHRYDTRSLREDTLRRFDTGIDCFFFDRATALQALEHSALFAIGVPWWDIWFPCVALLHNRKVTVVDRPAILHLAHKAAYSPKVFRKFGQVFANSVIAQIGTPSHSPAEVVTALLPQIREIAAPAREGAEFKQVAGTFCGLFIAAVRKKAENWKTPDDHFALPETPSSLKEIFGRVDQRISSGEALRKVRKLCASGRVSEISQDMIAALNETPNDLEAILALAEISFHRREIEPTRDLLTRAMDLDPDAPLPLYMMGNLLDATGESEQALMLFRRIAALDPAFQPAPMATAKTLWRMNRKGEAIAILDETIARHPGFLNALELSREYRKEIKSPIRSKIRRSLNQLKSALAASHVHRILLFKVTEMRARRRQTLEARQSKNVQD